MKKHRVILSVGVAAILLGLAWQVQAGVIAYWQFEPGAFTLDSSGNGNSLTNLRATQSTDTPPHVGGSGSAYFDGTAGSNAFMRTTNNLNLNSYNNIAISWWQKVDTSAVSIVWEHSPNYNSYDGGILSVVNETGLTPAYVAIRRTAAPAGYTLDTFPYTRGQWEQFTAVINLGLPASNTHEAVKVYRNGVLVSTDTQTTGRPSALRSDILYFGARSNGTVPFKGWIDEMKIETVSNYVNLVANHPNLVGYWRLGEGSGTTAWEVRGLTGNGTYVNVNPGDYAKPGAVRFDPDTAMAFNGTNSYVDAGNDPDLNGNWDGLTLMAWIKPETASLSGIHAILGKWNQTVAGDHYLLFLNDGKLGIAVGNGVVSQNGLLSQNTLLADRWYFVVGTWDKATGAYQLYINGMLDPATGTQTGTWQINTGSTVPLIIGAQVYGQGRYFAGLIDEAAIFNTRLSQAEIFALYALATVPEPRSWVLGGIGLASLFGLALGRKRQITSSKAHAGR